MNGNVSVGPKDIDKVTTSNDMSDLEGSKAMSNNKTVGKYIKTALYGLERNA